MLENLVNATPLCRESDGDLHGATLAGGSDLDGDGRSDLAVGAPGAEEGQGAVYVWYGPVRRADAEEADLKLSGEASGDQFGTALYLSQDLNGLGRLDLVVGATGANDGDGAVYVFFMDGL